MFLVQLDYYYLQLKFSTKNGKNKSDESGMMTRIILPAKIAKSVEQGNIFYETGIFSAISNRGNDKEDLREAITWGVPAIIRTNLPR